jgi:hypothetical protein
MWCKKQQIGATKLRNTLLLQIIEKSIESALDALSIPGAVGAVAFRPNVSM